MRKGLGQVKSTLNKVNGYAIEVAFATASSDDDDRRLRDEVKSPRDVQAHLDNVAGI